MQTSYELIQATKGVISKKPDAFLKFMELTTSDMFFQVKFVVCDDAFVNQELTALYKYLKKNFFLLENPNGVAEWLNGVATEQSDRWLLKNKRDQLDAEKKGMRTYVLGVGSPNGAPIPTGNGDYLKDNMGQTVMTGLNEDMCRQVATAGNGAYIHVDNNSNAQEQLDNELDKLSKKDLTSTIYSDFDEQFQAVGIIVLLLLILEICILEIKNPMLKRVSLFKRSAPSKI